MTATNYQPAAGYWRRTTRHRLLWAAIGALDRIERQGPEERELRPHQARLRRLIQRVVTQEAAMRWWRLLTKQEELPEEELERAISAIAAALMTEVRALRQKALTTTETRLGRGLPPELKERAIQEAFHLVRGVPDTLKEELRTMMRETLAQQKTQFDFAREIRKRWSVFAKRRAEVIARTEWARVAGRATLELYRQSGTRRKIWYTVGDARVCEICHSNAAAGPIAIDADFPGGVDTTPQHPICRCAVAGAI